MADRKWGAIADGSTFEAMATTLIFFEDSRAALFGRRGIDGGQDARSGDGQLVFQAKHHEDESATKAIADAKKEAAKISDYRKAGHARHEQWRSVGAWRLVTNAAFNPSDRQKWDAEVVPLFAAQGLSVDYWERANLDALLDKHPEVHRSFFENETRALLTLAEVRDRLPAQEPFLQRASLGAFYGREADVSVVRAFLASDELFLVLHGAGGIGKTRLLLEAGEEIASDGDWQVLWANVASMKATGAWFEAIVPERPTLLLVDEPPDEQLLQVLSEQLGGRVGRATKWKVAVAVRSPKDPVLRFMFAPRMKARVRELQVASLSDASAEAICRDLLNSGPLAKTSEEWRERAAQELARRFSRVPVWITLAVHALESEGDLAKIPETASGLADSYLEEIVRQQQQAPSDEVLALLRWVALLGTVNREDETAMTLIADGSRIGDANAVRGRLAGLVQRRALIQRGAKDRLVELKPDVLRDHVLAQWLSVNVGYGQVPVVPSDAAKVLVASARDAVLAGTAGALERAILASLGRTELLLQLSGQSVALLDVFFADARVAVAGLSPSQRIAFADVLVTIAAFRPTDTAALVTALRTSVAASETVDGIFRTRTFEHDDVVLELAWPLFRAAMGAQTASAREAVLSELCRLTETEAQIGARRGGLPNDGKRAAALVERTLEGGPQFWGDFEDAALTQAERLLSRLALQPPSAGDVALLKALVRPALALERRQTWSDDNAIHMQTYTISPAHPGWKTRASLLERIREIIAAGSSPPATRAALWRVFADAHRNTSLCRGRGEPAQQAELRAQLLDDLVWAGAVLSARGADLEELAAARDVWDWHHKFETDAKLKAESDELEALYARNDLATEFEPLLAHDDWKQREPRSAAKAAELAAESDPTALHTFVDRAARFLGGDQNLNRLIGVAADLGAHAAASETVRLFVTSTLAQADVSYRTDFGAVTAASWVASLRRGSNPSEAYTLVRELMKACGSEQQYLNVLLRTYGGVPRPSAAGALTREEHDLLRSSASLFEKYGRGPEFVAAVAVTLHHDWATLRPIVEGTLARAPQEQLVAVVASLVDAVYWAVRESDPAATPSDLAQWLLGQLLRLPDIDDLGGNVEWHIDEILKRIGRAPISWLPGALVQRMRVEA